MIVGIDPGLKGGIATVELVCKTIFPHTVPMPVLKAAKGYVLDEATILSYVMNAELVVLELQGTRPDEGRVSAFTAGTNFGILRGICSGIPVPYEIVHPRTWKSEFGLNSSKASAIAVCQALFPGVSLLRTDRCTKPHDGMAEALLIAEYGRRKLQGVSE